jgi:activator of 2-hydroxyglutaryl-CoA dehydratase/predicted nucleotide-binding protein (sugar kinase/HSP70/actin superfamily)
VPSQFLIGIDVGSTTVKAVVIDTFSDRLLWSDYRRHDTRQPETVLAFLKRFDTEIADFDFSASRAFVTGSGGSGLASHLGAKFVQEVNAVSLAVEKLHPECGSVIELGGQDAKIIIFHEDPATGRKRKLPSMNDKCAGGTGAVIDKIAAKLAIPPDQLSHMRYSGLKLHPVAGKCGVFAETDVNGLQKVGVPANELMASLFEAIVMQNLSVLTRGHTLRPVVLLLGGPNAYVTGLQECWKSNIPKIWAERHTSLPDGADPASLIRVPENAQYFAALGAVEFGKGEEDQVGQYRGWRDLEAYMANGREAHCPARAGQGSLAGEAGELERFRDEYRRPHFVPAAFRSGELVEGFVGIDGGSTSTKAVLLSKTTRQPLAKVYQLSQGHPFEDLIAVLGKLSGSVRERGAELKILGVGTTGYAKDMLKEAISADVALVETVAHTQAGLHFYKNIDVICDVGGQDIKIIVLKDGRVKDFRLNTQCSAGNGYFLQSTAQSFRVPVEQYADTAFSAQRFPEFGYGCAVFMQTDIVDFQRQGWKPEEIMAGLCHVLPRNIWLYVAQLPNLSALGSRFLLQGGTQYNLAAVKAQVDYIRSRFLGGNGPSIIVHQHCGEAGAIGAGLEAGRLWDNGRVSTFIGLEAVARLSYTATRSEATRCHFCKNDCLRTFVDIKTKEVTTELIGAIQPARASKVPLAPGARRFILATCDKGTVDDLEEMRHIKRDLDGVRKQHPSLVETAAHEAFRPPDLPSVADAAPRWLLSAGDKHRAALRRRRGSLRIGIPRVLNLYSTAPLFAGYFVSLGIRPENIIYSEYTNEQLYKDGCKRGSVDPCFPSKLGIPHVHNLLMVAHARRKLDLIFFPMIDCLPSALHGTQGSRACPTVTATPAAVKAAFTKEGDLFAEKGVLFLDTFVNISRPELLERQMLLQFKDILGLSAAENHRAVVAGYDNLARYEAGMRRRAREILDALERENRIGIVVLGRPYHNDPGVNHGILEELQKLGYPIFTQDSLPVEPDILSRLFGNEVQAGEIDDPLSIADVWKNSYSENTSRKVWAAKYVARHRNLVAVELSNFKCGHDAPIYTVVEEIVEQSGTPYFCFKDLDENTPSGSIKIRIETIDYFLRRYREQFVVNRERITRELAQYETRLRREYWKQRLEEQAATFEHGHVSRIDVPLEALAGSGGATGKTLR